MCFRVKINRIGFSKTLLNCLASEVVSPLPCCGAMISSKYSLERLEIQRLPDTTPYEAGAELSPFRQKHITKVFAAILGTQIEFPTLSPPHPRILGRRAPATYIGEPGLRRCTWEPLHASLPATTAPVSCLLGTATPINKRGLAGSVAPSCPSAVTFDTRANIISGGQAKFPLTTSIPAQQFAFWMTPYRASSYGLLLGTLRLLKPFEARSVHKRIKEAPSCAVLYATSTSPADESRGTQLAGSADLDRSP